MLLMQVEAPLEGNTLIRVYVYNTEILFYSASGTLK